MHDKSLFIQNRRFVTFLGRCHLLSVSTYQGIRPRWGLIKPTSSLMVFSHQSKTTTRQRLKNVKPMRSYDAFHTSSDKDKTNMVWQWQDDKTKQSWTMFIFCLVGQLLDGKSGGYQGGLPDSPTRTVNALQETVSTFSRGSGVATGCSWL